MRLPRLCAAILLLAAKAGTEHRLPLHWRRSVLSWPLAVRPRTAAGGLHARRLLLLWGVVVATVLRPKLRRPCWLSPRRRRAAKVAGLHRRRMPWRGKIR